MMSSPTDSGRQAEAVAVAQRYLQRERPLSHLLTVIVISLFLGSYLVTSLLPAVVVGAVSVVVVHAPVFRPHGTVRVRSDDDPETVRAAFAGATPPVLAFQWGIADTVTTENGTATYTVSYLFGLRSADIAVHPHATTVDGNAHVELTVKTNDQEWATYTATIRGDGDRTVVDIEYTSDRRFGLRRLPQRLVARRYRDAALEAQGYYVIERDSHIR